MKLISEHPLVLILSLLAFAWSTPACTPNDGGQNDDGTSGADSNGCDPGELGCSCSDGQCFPPYDCVAELCVDPNCTPGSEFCQCAEGNLCLGEFECVDAVCMDPENACVPEAYYRCNDGGVYWFDSCD